MKDKDKFYFGYKGTGMCKNCDYSQVSDKTGSLICTWYDSACKLVSRNCKGIKSLKHGSRG